MTGWIEIDLPNLKMNFGKADKKRYPNVFKIKVFIVFVGVGPRFHINFYGFVRL